MKSSISVVLGTKYRIVDNFVREIRNHLWIHVAAGIMTLIMIILGGGVFFWYIFNFLRGQEPFGAPLMERLMSIVLLAFFSMLVFSNLIITLTTTYISRETEFLMSFPMRFQSVFVVKLVESIVYSSWAFTLLSIPLFAAYGISKHAPLYFYPAAFLISVPFLVIPASLGALITMLISAYLPAKKARLYSLGLMVAAVGVTAILVRLMGLRSMVMSANVEDFSRLMTFLNAGSLPLLPNFWLARGMEAISEGGMREYGYWFLVLLSTAMMSIQVCLWLAPGLYYRGWALAKESASATYTTGGSGFFSTIDRLFRPFTPPVRALLGKDVRTFWRDPAQWSQLIILFGLLFIYIANIRGLTRQMQGMEAFLKHWPTILSFFNIGATCFVLSILTTRFIYPMLSLEGKQYWVVGLAPFPKQKLVWEKFALCLFGSSAIAFPLILLSNTMLDVRPILAAIGLVAITTLGIGLTSLAVGLGAMFPNFKEDNPARIANGMGGTVNILFSLFYIVINMAILIPFSFQATSISDMGHASGAGTFVIASEVASGAWPFLIGFLLVNLAVAFVPMRLGLRRWMNLEFHV